MSLANKFHLHPDQVFKDIETTLRKQQEEIAALRDELAANSVSRRSGRLPAIGHRWFYDAFDPAYFTDVLSISEQTPSGKYKRWVVDRFELAFALNLRRDLSYVVTTTTADVPEDAQFSAKVDGVTAPVQVNEGSIRFVAPRNAESFALGAGISLSLQVDRLYYNGAGEDKRTLAFSVVSIDVDPIEIVTSIEPEKA